METTTREEANPVQETQFSQLESIWQDDDNSQRNHENLTTDSSTPTISASAIDENGVVPAGRNTRQSNTSARALAPDLLRGLLMVLQAIDHAAVSSNAWPHGVAIDSEADSARVKKWNDVVPWTARMLTHLCAPGFMFLLGMGVVYFGRSRTKLGWSAARMTRHFAIRAVALAGINQLLTLGIAAESSFKSRIWVLNIVLLALAVNYFISGIIWQILSWTEQALANAIAKVFAWKERDHNSLRQPLLQASRSESGLPVDSTREKSEVAATISWYFHTLMLLVFCIVTIFWNIMFSPTHGHCQPSHTSPFELLATYAPEHTGLFEFLFHSFITPTIISPFPPLAWLSFAVLGLLYARIILSRPLRPSLINLINFLLGLFFLLVFILTRVLHSGNLSEDCLDMPEHKANPDRNQYMASFRSFFYFTKYPPDVAFMGYSMGINFLFLSLFGFVSAKWTARIPFSTLLTYGTSALFFYTVHLPIYGILGSLAKNWFGRPVDFKSPGAGGSEEDVEYGIGYGIGFWSMWLVGLAILWPLCWWYGNFKRRQGPESVWRFF